MDTCTLTLMTEIKDLKSRPVIGEKRDDRRTKPLATNCSVVPEIQRVDRVNRS
ncbi:hypothetical protein [Paraburkholderia sp. BR10879]|uniref:hypothetical protein n=1 Tax=Paraburkholderia sp. BR10879 TaxID=3236990 RepID=UPI00397A6153